MIYFFWEWCKIDNLMWSVLKKWVYKIKKVDSYTKIIINFITRWCECSNCVWMVGYGHTDLDLADWNQNT